MVAFIYDFARKTRGTSRYKAVYRCIAKKLDAYEKDRDVKLMSDMFSDHVAEDFIYYLKDQGLMLNTIAGYYSKVCHVLRRMGKRGYAVDYSFEYVRVGEEDAQAVYITESEFERISNMKIESAERELIRDAFVANYCVGMRLSDFRKLTAENVRGGIVTRKTRKTGVTVEVPVHRLLKAILEKYGGNFPPYQKSSQNYNKVIKNICKQAGLNDKVLIERTKGHKVVRKTMKRFELVSSHTARRSFATNAYLAGIPTARIMLITGHKTEAAFFTYIRIDRKENARTLSDHAFFK